MRYHVGLYLLDRAYGGPEEGGWWYGTSERVDLADLPSAAIGESYIPKSFDNEEDALAHRDKLREQIVKDKLNDGRPPAWSVASQGTYDAEMYEGDALPENYPAERPHYE